jgi:hypothetical protein
VQVVGISGAMAQKIVDRYSTPAALVAAYAAAPDVATARKLLSTLRASDTAGRALGDVASARVHAMVTGGAALPLPAPCSARGAQAADDGP